MSLSLPNLFFRVKENGATVFRVTAETRQNRLDMTQVATVNIRNGDIKVQNNKDISDTERTEIEAWIETRRAVLDARHMDDVHRTVDFLNHTAQWVQSRATDDQLEEITDILLLTMHDLRSLLVRKKADRVMAARPKDD
ncbi:conserved hypothetical protein [Dinoroseobacter shibae DFL 12 = DSM 16493]|uniref:Uncharacterized protein n=1 Tax=Dinoroseobacter shibae (strain DSM 16493 / NCIMB 14021 / DFL 12) TaxID=398580 RepID=A8LQW3_DINSH|nr:hypothetical protein [Dinoroseobacter shibae]ABV92506.1 conserved hypothetical protein [Dinoroseobacter shibae DFL 12 = DSM 16493]URF47450.1 hypothetical protein M8008_03935 [Dinoroseobacter shibae]URF51761.1 hypothetical protein M8007_03935 [Dinoroseobacter shibae]